jgi:hypothetical protein
MLGYRTGDDSRWHVVLVRRGSDGEGRKPGLWVMPRLACRRDGESGPAGDADELHSEYRRFAVCKYGITIALSQRPHNLGCLLYGIHAEDETGPDISECGMVAGTSSCTVKRILREIGVEKVQLEYPHSNNLQRCLDSCTGALDSCSAACFCTLPGQLPPGEEQDPGSVKRSQ